MSLRRVGVEVIWGCREAKVACAQTGALHVPQSDRTATAKIDHRVAADLRCEGQHVGECPDSREFVQCDLILAARTGTKTKNHVRAIAGAVDEAVVAGAAIEEVRAKTAVKPVGTRTAEQPVVAGATRQRVAGVGRLNVGRQAEHLAADVDDVEVAARILAERGGRIDRTDIGHDLRRAVGRDPVGAVEPQGEDLALHEVGEEILAVQSIALAAIDIAAGDRGAAAVRIGIDRIDECSDSCSTPSTIGQP